ncbi:hypothetical protein CC86DRAFT_277679 [Ophiobolus disseminans]|uniref:Rhodopsin domain-containing protein n=1 Tax=Ophiobolus disseminans TaxID=1469910 RepID=A0A6A7ALZ6_9PLEO|nr:hypothetical protein CC86DRAFT_277679 [Ophiobolus disseminans]
MRDLQPTILATNVLLIALSSAAIACRAGRRLFLVRSFDWHDALITVAAISASIFSILQMISTHYGLGTTNSEVLESHMRIIMKLTMASRIFYFLCNWAVKHSLLLFYATLTIDRLPRLSIYAMHFVAFAFGVTCIFVTIFQCKPVNKTWLGPDNPTVPKACIDMDDFNYFNSSFMLATDLILYAMPLAFTWRLHVSRPQRIAVNILFMLGSLVLAASAARVYFVYAQATDPDFTYRFAMTMICAVIENHLAIIVACAPSIKVILLLAFPALETKFEKLVSKSSSGNTDYSGGTLAYDFESGLGGQGEVSPKVRPLLSRATSGDSWRSIRDAKKWWKAPSDWEVSKEGKEGCAVETTTPLSS